VKVFVAGSTGVIGVPTVRALRAAGHEVVGMTRSPGKRGLMRSLGADAAIADALDAPAVREAVLAAKPDAIVQLLTALPDVPARLSHLRATNVLRRDGTRNLIAAASDAGVGRYVSESIVFAYGEARDPNAVRTEDDEPVRSLPGASERDDVLAALASLEDQVRAFGGVVLRFGLYYGPNAGSTLAMVKLLRRGMAVLPGGGHGIGSWIHVDDAASAIVAALERGRPGEVYNIVDDEPVELRAYMSELARVAHGHGPRSVPAALGRLVAPYLTESLAGVWRVSNAKAKRELGWTLRYPTYREGLATLAAGSPA
jgi:nucleoside-diphosphate-sugar epimerase